MTPYQHLPDYAAIHDSDIFWRAVPRWRDNDSSYLLPGQTEWFGPTPVEGDEACWLGRHEEEAIRLAKLAARRGIHLHIQTVGAYIRTHRLRVGPTKKLSDWIELPAGVLMLLNPLPTAEDVERAINRGRYMRLKGFGQFRSWTDDGGRLWAERLQAAP